MTPKWNVLGKQKKSESETDFEKPRKEGWRAWFEVVPAEGGLYG